MEWGVVSYINARKHRFQNAIPSCVLLRKNFQNGIPVHCVTKIPLVTGICTKQLLDLAKRNAIYFHGNKAKSSLDCSIIP
jgi:hypothetical protein